jgi:hypothetical protein
MSYGDGAIMELWRLGVLRGPNVWAACPVLEAGVDVSAWAGQPWKRRVQARERLRAWLPLLDDVGENAGLARVFERVWLHLQNLAGNPVRFSDTRPVDRGHRYRVAVEYQDEPVSRACLDTALTLCRAAWEGRSYAVAEEIERLRHLAAELRLEPSTLALVEAARARGIPVERINPEDSGYLLLGHGARQRRCLGTVTEDVSALARSVAADKSLTRQLLRDAGVPVAAADEKAGAVHRVLVVEERVVAVARHDRESRPVDVTETIHPETAACAVAAAQALRMRVAGIDLVATDIARPLQEQGGGIAAVHTGPGLELHLAPWNDRPRPVGAAIVASLFPHGSDGRIPVVAVTGGQASFAGQCLAALLTDAGYRVGRASRDGVFLAGRRINLEDATAYEKARAVLRNPLVDVAVLEAEAHDLIRKGFGCDRCDVVLVTDPPEAEDSDEPAHADIEEAWTAVLHALTPDGKAVLNAENPPAFDAALLSADRLIWFAETGTNVRLTDHRAAGGAAVFLCGDSLAVARGVEEQRLPFGGRPVEREPREQLALLAALAGAMALNLCGDEEQSATREPANTALEAALSAV